MAVATSRIRSRRNKVLRSVFQVDISQPTPPLAFAEPGEAFGGPATFPPSVSIATLSSQHDGAEQPACVDHPPPPPPHQALQLASDQVRWDRAWHAVTSRLLLPSSVTVEDSFGSLPASSEALDAAFYDSLALVLNPQQTLPRAAHTEDILQWHTQQIRNHFSHHVLPLLAACGCQEDPAQVLTGSIQTLEAAHRLYSHGLYLILRGLDDESLAALTLARFRRDLHAVIGGSWSVGLVNSLTHVMRQRLRQILMSPSLSIRNPTYFEEERQAKCAQDELLSLAERLHQVGLAGEKFQVLFAELLDATMVAFIPQNYSGMWEPFGEGTGASASSTLRTGCIGHLSDWVENHYGRLAVEVLSRIGGKVDWADVERWKEAAIGRLATLRIHELYDIVQSWPNSKGALDDLRPAVTTPQRRLQLTDTFSATLQKRLLHPGRSTLYILQTYIAMIRTFHALDHSKVLLGRVVHSLQLYLCQRDDAIRIVVTGLLSAPSPAGPEEKKGKLTELAHILNEASKQKRQVSDDDELDWNDMTWVPDPVDAGVNYKRPKNEDVIGTLISALGAQDIFIKEFQLIIAERLLSNQTTFVQETKVLGLLKRRFGENALQNCDVMLKDIQDSKRVDYAVGKGLPLGEDVPTYHSKILSRLFWPSLPKDSFAVPPQVASLREHYARGFEHLKSSRSLTWLDQLGSASVTLEFEDRTIEVECKTYEASVIYCFQDEASEAGRPQQRHFNDLWTKLMLDEDLLAESLAFWVSKRVLRDNGDQTFVVLERLGADGEGEHATAGSAEDEEEDAEQMSPRKTKGIDPAEQARRMIYWQFIVGMLTNSSAAMPLGQILMTLKMLIADGCPWSNEELQEFLGEKVAAGGLELAGGKYRLPKK